MYLSIHYLVTKYLKDRILENRYFELILNS